MPFILIIVIVVAIVWSVLRRTTSRWENNILYIMSSKPRQSWSANEIAVILNADANRVAGYLEGMCPSRVTLVSVSINMSGGRDTHTSYRLKL